MASGSGSRTSRGEEDEEDLVRSSGARVAVARLRPRGIRSKTRGSNGGSYGGSNRGRGARVGDMLAGLALLLLHGAFANADETNYEASGSLASSLDKAALSTSSLWPSGLLMIDEDPVSAVRSDPTSRQRDMREKSLSARPPAKPQIDFHFSSTLESPVRETTNQSKRSPAGSSVQRAEPSFIIPASALVHIRNHSSGLVFSTHTNTSFIHSRNVPPVSAEIISSVATSPMTMLPSSTLLSSSASSSLLPPSTSDSTSSWSPFKNKPLAHSLAYRYSSVPTPPSPTTGSYTPYSDEPLSFKETINTSVAHNQYKAFLQSPVPAEPLELRAPVILPARQPSQEPTSIVRKMYGHYFLSTATIPQDPSSETRMQLHESKNSMFTKIYGESATRSATTREQLIHTEADSSVASFLIKKEIVPSFISTYLIVSPTGLSELYKNPSSPRSRNTQIPAGEEQNSKDNNASLGYYRPFLTTQVPGQAKNKSPRATPQTLFFETDMTTMESPLIAPDSFSRILLPSPTNNPTSVSLLHSVSFSENTKPMLTSSAFIEYMLRKQPQETSTSRTLKPHEDRFLDFWDASPTNIPSTALISHRIDILSSEATARALTSSRPSISAIFSNSTAKHLADSLSSTKTSILLGRKSLTSQNGIISHFATASGSKKRLQETATSIYLMESGKSFNNNFASQERHFSVTALNSEQKPMETSSSFMSKFLGLAFSKRSPIMTPSLLHHKIMHTTKADVKSDYFTTSDRKIPTSPGILTQNTLFISGDTFVDGTTSIEVSKQTSASGLKLTPIRLNNISDWKEKSVSSEFSTNWTLKPRPEANNSTPAQTEGFSPIKHPLQQLFTTKNGLSFSSTSNKMLSLHKVLNTSSSSSSSLSSSSNDSDLNTRGINLLSTPGPVINLLSNRISSVSSPTRSILSISTLETQTVLTPGLGEMSPASSALAPLPTELSPSLPSESEPPSLPPSPILNLSTKPSHVKLLPGSSPSPLSSLELALGSLSDVSSSGLSLSKPASSPSQLSPASTEDSVITDSSPRISPSALTTASPSKLLPPLLPSPSSSSKLSPPLLPSPSLPSELSPPSLPSELSPPLLPSPSTSASSPSSFLASLMDISPASTSSEMSQLSSQSASSLSELSQVSSLSALSPSELSAVSQSTDSISDLSPEISPSASEILPPLSSPSELLSASSSLLVSLLNLSPEASPSELSPVSLSTDLPTAPPFKLSPALSLSASSSPSSLSVASPSDSSKASSQLELFSAVSPSLLVSSSTLSSSSDLTFASSPVLSPLESSAPSSQLMPSAFSPSEISPASSSDLSRTPSSSDLSAESTFSESSLSSSLSSSELLPTSLIKFPIELLSASSPTTSSPLTPFTSESEFSPTGSPTAPPATSLSELLTESPSSTPSAIPPAKSSSKLSQNKSTSPTPSSKSSSELSQSSTSPSSSATSAELVPSASDTALSAATPSKFSAESSPTLSSESSSELSPSASTTALPATKSLELSQESSSELSPPPTPSKISPATSQLSPSASTSALSAATSSSVLSTKESPSPTPSSESSSELSQSSLTALSSATSSSVLSTKESPWPTPSSNSSSELSPSASTSALSAATSSPALSASASPSASMPTQLSTGSPPTSSSSSSSPASLPPESSPTLESSSPTPSQLFTLNYDFVLKTHQLPLTKTSVPSEITLTSLTSSSPSPSLALTSAATSSYYEYLLTKQFTSPSSPRMPLALSPLAFPSSPSTASYHESELPHGVSVSSSKPLLEFSQNSALIPFHLLQQVSEIHVVVTEKSTLDQWMSGFPSSVLTSRETRLPAKGNDSALPPFQMIRPTLPNKNINTSVQSEPLTQELPASKVPQLTPITTMTAFTTTTASTTTTQLTSTTQVTSTIGSTTSATSTTIAKPSRTIAPTSSPKWTTTTLSVRTSPPRTTTITTTTESSPHSCNITDRMWVKTVLSVHIRRNRLDNILKHNLPRGLTLALTKVLNDSSVRAKIESLSTMSNVTVGYYVTRGNMVYTSSFIVEALSSYGMDRLMADIRQFVPMVQALPTPAAPWRPTPTISLMLKTVLRFVGPGDDLRSCRFAELMEERLENAFAEAEAKVLNSYSTLSVEILSVSQSAGSPAVSLVYVVQNRTETLNGTAASNLLNRLTAELVGYFLFYPPLIIAEPLEYHNLNTSAATKDFWVITVIQDVENSSLEGQYQSFASLMEQRLAELFMVAHQQGVRFKRANTVGSYTVQMVGMRRVVGPKNPAELTYYVQLNGMPLPGTTAAKFLNTVDSQTMALTLGYFVQLQAEAVVKGPSNNLWIIASVLAPISIVTIIIIIITAVLCHKNKSDFKTDGIGNLNPRVKTTYRRDMSYYHQPVQGFDYAKQHLGQLGSDEDSAPLPQAPLQIRDASLKVIHPDGTNSKKTIGGEIRKSRLPSEDGSAVSVESVRPVSVRGSSVKKISTQQNLTKEESKKRTDPYDTSSGSLQLISVNQIAAPPAYSQPASSDRSQDSAVLNGEVNLALKQKSDIEHYRNKLRLKAKRKGYYDFPSGENNASSKPPRHESEKAERTPVTRPSSRTPEYEDDRSSTYVKSRRRHSEVKYPAYRSRQSLNSPSPGGTEMDLLVMRERPRKGIRNSGYDTEPEIIAETDVDGLAARRHYGYGRHAKGHSETSTLSSQPSIDEVRQQMHLLLEEAFSLASAGHTSSSRRHHYHQQHQAISPYSPGPSIPYSEGPTSAPDTINHTQGGLQWVPAYGHDLYQCSLSKPTFRFTQLPEMVTDTDSPPPPPVPPRTGPVPRSSLQRSSSDVGPKAPSSQSSVPDMQSQQDSNTYVPISRGPLPPITTEPVLNHSGNPMTAVYAIPTSRQGYPGYFLSTPPSSYHSPSWMSYPPEPEDVSTPWTDSVPLPGYAEAFPNPRYPRGSVFQWTPSQAVSPPQVEPDQPFSLSTDPTDVITPITLSTSALVQAIRDEVAKLAKKQADMFEFQV